MLPKINDIKTLRRSLGITQKELAKQTRVSQSYITKIERQTTNPPYNLVKEIFEYLERIEKTRQKTQKTLLAKDIMTTNIKKIKPKDTLKKAIKIMNQHDISQLPVIKKDKQIGSITHKTIPKLISENKKDVHNIRIKKIMEKPFPIISEDTIIKIVSDMLKNQTALITTQKGKITGIITSHDLHKII